MDPIDPQAGMQMIAAMLQPWHAAVADPPSAQDQVLQRLLKDYAQTRYGREHNAAQVASTTTASSSLLSITMVIARLSSRLWRAI